MKIFDATAVIAFLNDMDYSEGIIKLSKHYEIVIPEGVVGEIKRSPRKEMLQDLISLKLRVVATCNRSEKTSYSLHVEP